MYVVLIRDKKDPNARPVVAGARHNGSAFHPVSTLESAQEEAYLHCADETAPDKDEFFSWGVFKLVPITDAQKKSSHSLSEALVKYEAAVEALCCVGPNSTSEVKSSASARRRALEIARMELQVLTEQANSLTFAQMQEENSNRCRRWHTGPEGMNEWTALEWAGAMCGEAGEAANAAKKLRRLELGMQQASGDTPAPTDLHGARARVLKEVGDTVIYAGLLCERVGGTLEEAVREAFNSVSVREGFPERL